MEKNEKKLNKKFICVITFVVVAAAALVIFLWNNRSETYRNVSVIDAIGNVDVYRESKNAQLAAYVNMQLVSGDDVKVGDASELDLKLDDDKYVYADEKTHLWLDSEGTSENSKTIIHVEEGSVLHKIDKKLNADSTYQIQTPNATMAIRGTIVSSNVYKNEEGDLCAEYSFYEGFGEVHLVSKSGEPLGAPVTIEQGKKCTLRSDMTKSSEIEIADVDYASTSPWLLSKLQDIRDGNRDLYCGNEKVDWNLRDGQPVKEEVATQEETETTEEPQESTQSEEPENKPEEPASEEVASNEPEPQSQQVQQDEEPVEQEVPQQINNIGIVRDDSPSKASSWIESGYSDGDGGSGSGSAAEESKVNKIIFMNKEEVISSQTVTPGDVAKMPQKNPSENGEWQLNGAAYDFSTPVTSDITLQWKEKE